MARLPSFMGGVVAGVALCVAPATFLLLHYSGKPLWPFLPYFAAKSFFSPWQHVLSLL